MLQAVAYRPKWRNPTMRGRHNVGVRSVDAYWLFSTISGSLQLSGMSDFNQLRTGFNRFQFFCHCREAYSSGFRLRVEMCMGMGFPMGPGIPWESHRNGNKTQKWEWEWEGMGNHLSGNGNYLHSHGNLFPKVLCWDELKLLVLYLPDANAYCAEFADYRNCSLNLSLFWFVHYNNGVKGGYPATG